MSRSVRAAVAGVGVFALLLVAAGAGMVSTVASDQAREDRWWTEFSQEPPGELFTDPVTVPAEVLDVDASDDGWTTLDVAFESEDGDRQVTSVYLELPTGEDVDRPRVGDTVEVVHQAGDPESAVSADDPMLTGEAADIIEAPLGPDREASESLARRTGRLALGSLVAALLVAGLGAAAVLRAPPQQPRVPVRLDRPTDEQVSGPR